jgi:hypothetical protein
MKAFILIFGLMMSIMVHAETPEVWARNVTCQELKTTLANYGSVKVYSRFLGIRTTSTVYTQVDCSVWEHEVTGVFGTKDIRNCHVGSYCMREMRDRDFPRCNPRFCAE